jgi:hypothetical protein
MQLRLRAQQFMLALLVLTSLYASIQYLLSTSTAGEIDFDHVANWESRFKPVLEALPIQRGTLGYLAEWDVPGADYVASDLDAEYILTQYAFSPFILARGVDHEWIVGSISPHAYELWKQTRVGEYEDQKFKGNVYLFHRLDLMK